MVRVEEGWQKRLQKKRVKNRINGMTTKIRMVRSLQSSERSKCVMCDKQATHAIDYSIDKEDKDSQKIEMAHVCDEHFDKIVEDE
jgi:hypothetical protein